MELLTVKAPARTLERVTSYLGLPTTFIGTLSRSHSPGKEM
jgi:hypothetical protein